MHLYDLIIYCNTFEEHTAHVRAVLRLLQTNGVTLRRAKCAFFETEVDHVGHIIRPRKLELSMTTCIALKRALPPTTQTELRSFLGLCNLFRRFVPSSACIPVHLNRKLEKHQPVGSTHLSDEEFQSFDRLKPISVSPPILVLPGKCGTYMLDTDACEDQLSCALLQAQEDTSNHPIGYWSKSLDEAQKNYNTTEREYLGVVWALLLLRPYLDGHKLTLLTE